MFVLQQAKIINILNKQEKKINAVIDLQKIQEVRGHGTNLKTRKDEVFIINPYSLNKNQHCRRLSTAAKARAGYNAGIPDETLMA